MNTFGAIPVGTIFIDVESGMKFEKIPAQKCGKTDVNAKMVHNGAETFLYDADEIKVVGAVAKVS